MCAVFQLENVSANSQRDMLSALGLESSSCFD